MRYDFSFPDQTFPLLKKLNIQPITDLCHFGVPDFIQNFQNPDFPALFAEYAGAFARRYPWIRLYTPVNEIFVAARFSAELGWWNERLSSDRAFVTALKHLARANVLASQEILKVQPDALFIQSESSEYFHPSTPDTQSHADFLNQRRFLSLDLCFGTDVSATLYEYLLDNGLSRDEYHFFLSQGQALRPHCIMGNDYYITNEHEVVSPPQSPPQSLPSPSPSARPPTPPQNNHAPTAENAHFEIHPSGEIFGYYVITHQYYQRYRLPVMHTETNRKSDEEAPAWLLKQCANVVRLKRDGVPILGFTWYSLLDQTDWDTALREDNHRINPMGLFDLHRNERKVASTYRQLIRLWQNELPAQSMSRDLSITPPESPPQFPHDQPTYQKTLTQSLNHFYGPQRSPSAPQRKANHR
jgi:beta-glucosidase/6-phospho-beta-glucosidase/beta-galactosidase